MQIAFLYSKVRTEFGQHCRFRDEPAEPLTAVPAARGGPPAGDGHVYRSPGVFSCDGRASMSEHEVFSLPHAATTSGFPNTNAALHIMNKPRPPGEHRAPGAGV